MVTPVLSKYAVSLGASLTVAGTIAGLFSIAALVIRSFSGVVADRLNNKWLMTGSTAVISLSVLGYSFSSTIPVLVAFRVLHGVAFAISGTTNIAIFYTVNALTLFVIRPLGGRLNDKKGLSFVLVPAFIISGAAMVIVAGANATWMIAVAGGLKAIGQGTGQPAIQAECLRKLPEKQGVATSAYFIGADVWQGLGPIIGGAVSAAFGYGAMYAGAGALLFAGMAGYTVYRKIIGPRENGEISTN